MSDRTYSILVLNNGGSLNNGTMAMALALIEGITAAGVKPRVGILTSHPSIDAQRFNKDIFVIIPSPWRTTNTKRLRTLHFALLAMVSGIKLLLYRISNGRFFKSDTTINWYAESNIIIEQSGDSLTEDYSVMGGFLNFFPLFFAYLIKKPYYVISASIGPFHNKYLRSFASFVLRNAKFITSREKITERYLINKLNISKEKVIPVADLAFLLEPASGNRLNDILAEVGLDKISKPIIGISISNIIYKWGFSSLPASERRRVYVETFSLFLDDIIQRYDIHLLFVPHVMMPHSDDRTISREIIGKMKNKEAVSIVEREYLPGEIKGIIKGCDLFIATRMHAAIAALSKCIPTLVLAYSHKAIGIVGEMLNLTDCLIDMRGVSQEKLAESLNDRFAYVWNHADLISKHLVKELVTVKNNSAKNVDLVLQELPAS